jgi:hypothetical protein
VFCTGEGCFVALVLLAHAFKVKLEETLAKTAMNAEKIRLIQRIDRLPDSLIRPVFDFVEFLLWRQKASSEDTASTEDGPNAEDLAWLNSDLSNLGAYEPYEWAEGELEEGKPVTYVPGKGFVIGE